MRPLWFLFSNSSKAVWCYKVATLFCWPCWQLSRRQRENCMMGLDQSGYLVPNSLPCSQRRKNWLIRYIELFVTNWNLLAIFLLKRTLGQDACNHGTLKLFTYCTVALRRYYNWNQWFAKFSISLHHSFFIGICNLYNVWYDLNDSSQNGVKRHPQFRDHFEYAPSQWDVTMWCCLSLVGCIHKMIPEILSSQASLGVSLWGFCRQFPRPQLVFHAVYH